MDPRLRGLFILSSSSSSLVLELQLKSLDLGLEFAYPLFGVVQRLPEALDLVRLLVERLSELILRVQQVDVLQRTVP